MSNAFFAGAAAGCVVGLFRHPGTCGCLVLIALLPVVVLAVVIYEHPNAAMLILALITVPYTVLRYRSQARRRRTYDGDDG